ncbi:thioesterase domain-containing protein, partial [Saccharothrix sp. ST-888]|uniref:thioesterase domain-containing protein n=1 Tax=Saccharothrix sp. ST-888 TaxID=1427391 RepID=UPI0005ECB460
GPDDDFFDLGGDSLMALHLIAKANTTFDIELPHHTLLEAPTAARMATYIDDVLRSQEASASLITLREGAPGRRPLFLFHPVGGSVYVYREFARRLPAGQPVHAFQAAGLHDGAVPRRSVEELADRYLAELRTAQPVGPYALGGAAFGGLVALEVAQRLRAAGETVELLALFDTPGPGQMPLNRHAELSPAETDQLLAERLAARGVEPGQAVDASARQVLAVYRANLEALYAYRPAPYPGRALYFLAERRREGLDPARPDSAWRRLALGGLTTHILPGDYHAMFASANAETSARIVATELRTDGGR